MPAELLRGFIELVAHNRQLHPPFIQFPECFNDAGIRMGVIETMQQVVLSECRESILERRIGKTAGNRSFHQFLYTVSHKVANFLKGPLRHSMCAQSVIATQIQVLQGVE